MSHTTAPDLQNTFEPRNDAKAVYNVDQWSEGYFGINEAGELVAYPDADQTRSGIPLPEIAKRLKDEGLTLPVLVRFTDILQHRVDRLVQAFSKAKQDFGYQGEYTAVYPIKVNQQQSVVKKLIEHKSGHVGLEAGSKPELMAIMGVTEHPIRIVCNGYKDAEFIRLACIGQTMGHDVHLVIEKLSELNTYLETIQDFAHAPKIGVRIRLHSVGKGKWQNTGGEKGKFGLTALQVLQLVKQLQEVGQLERLRLVHFHIGSQVANIRDIQRALRECSRHFVALTQLGAPIETVDVGGGLGVDYEGSGSRSACSMNYTIDEYARNVVHALVDICDQEGIKHPNIITESGRAMTAHHALLITDVIDIEQAPANNVKKPGLDAPMIVRHLWQVYSEVSKRRAVEAHHDAVHYFSEAQSEYVHGLMSLSQLSEVEHLYFSCLRKISNVLDPSSRSHREILDDIHEKLADKLFANFSLFQSLPDAWGIDQLFPVMPLHHMNESLSQRAILQDITCDSDGQIKRYVDGAGIEASLPLPAYRQGDNYLLGIFMLGAYQEILGDMHNLFGDTDSVHVTMTETGYVLDQSLKGDLVKDVLRYVHFDADELMRSYQTQLAKLAIVQEKKDLYLKELSAGLSGYTYFEGSSVSEGKRLD